MGAVAWLLGGLLVAMSYSWVRRGLCYGCLGNERLHVRHTLQRSLKEPQEKQGVRPSTIDIAFILD